MTFLDLFYIFLFYSFFGWFLETIFISLKRRHFVNMGFLDGPFSPIYGFGALAIVLFVFPFKNNLPLFFILSIIVTSLLEYLTSYVLEKIFKIKWWNYSTQPLNLHGRICLEASFYWGILSMLVLTFVHPQIIPLTSFLSHKIGLAGFIAFLIYFIFDATDTTINIIKLKKILNQPIKIHPQFSNKIKRLFNAFPDLKLRK